MSKEQLAYLKKVIKASKQYRNALKHSIKQEPEMRKSMLIREREMAEADGIQYSETELENIVSKQMENNPYRVAVTEGREAYLKAVSGNG